MRSGGLAGRSNLSYKTTGTNLLAQDHLDPGKVPVEACPVFPVLDDDVVPVHRVRSGFGDHPFPGGKDIAPHGGRQVQPFVDPETPRNRVGPGPKGAGKGEAAQGKAEAPVEEEDPLRGAKIVPGEKAEGAYRVTQPAPGNLYGYPVTRFPGSAGGGHKPLKVGIRLQGNKKPRHGGKEEFPPQGREAGQPVDGGKGREGDTAPGGYGQEIFPFPGNIAVDGESLGQGVRRPAEDLAAGDFHITLVLDKTHIPVVKPDNQGHPGGRGIFPPKGCQGEGKRQKKGKGYPLPPKT